MEPTTEPIPVVTPDQDEIDALEDMRVRDISAPSLIQTPTEPVGIIDMPAPHVEEPAPRESALITEVPGLLIQKPSAEIQPSAEHAGFDSAADTMISDVPHLNETQRFYMSKAFLDSVVASVGRGEVISGGKVMSTKAFKDRLYMMLDDLNKPEDKREFSDPFELLPRSGGLRQSFVKLLGEQETATRVMDAIRDMKFKAESPEAAGVVTPGVEPKPSKNIDQDQRSVDTTAEDQVLTPAQEVAKIEDIRIKRAIQDYTTLMVNADMNERANGYNRDVEDYRRRADDQIKYLPTAMKELAKSLYKSEKQS